jgi:hypothetical protein
MYKLLKKSKKSCYLSAVLLYIGAFTLSNIYFPAQAAAASGTFLLYYPDDESSKLSIKRAFDKSGSEGIEDPARQKTAILANDVSFGLSNPVTLKYSEEDNRSFFVNAGSASSDIQDEQIWTAKYYCSKDSGKSSAAAPGGTGVYYEVVVAVGLRINDGNEFFKKTHGDTYAGAAYIAEVTPAKPGANGQPGTQASTNIIKQFDGGVEKLNDNIDKITKKECRPTPTAEGGGITVKNYYTGATDAERAAAKPAVDNATDPANGGNGSGPAKDEDSCDAKGGSPLSWIICPVIDLGSKFTDFVFNDIVRPFLEDVPISSAPDDPSYVAWKQFRLIGNIVLIGALLAVVYAQARGDK